MSSHHTAAMSRWWPLFGLRVRTPRLELRPVTDSDLDAYGDLLGGGIHPPDQMPFTVPWTDVAPPELQAQGLQYHWRLRAEWQPDAWTLAFGVWEDGVLVGQQDVGARQFRVLGTVETGSWVGLAHQGRGIGKEMRAAVLHFAFDGLGAARAETEAFTDNPASLAVTRSLGYLPNGDHLGVRREQAARYLRYQLPRDVWAELRRDDITVEGLEPCRARFGLHPET